MDVNPVITIGNKIFSFMSFYISTGSKYWSFLADNSRPKLVNDYNHSTIWPGKGRLSNNYE